MNPTFLLRTAVAAALFTAPLHAQQDAPPVDVAQILQALKALKETQAAQVKAARAKAMTEIQGAALSGERAVAAWEEAVRQVQFEGAAKEGTQFRAWKEKEGDALKNPLCQNAARLYFVWLGLTIQRGGGTPVKELLPQVVDFTKAISASQLKAEDLEDSIKRQRELDASGKHGARRGGGDDADVKKMHDQILMRPVGASPVVKALGIEEFVSDKMQWEKTPGNIEGIFGAIILPELRLQKDPRLLEYWDMKIAKETAAATKSKLAYDAEKFNTQRRPQLQWNKAQDILLLGQRNRAINEMFNVLKAHPAHPDAGNWVGKLEEVLLPPAATAATPGA